jgi:hypothetical protein
VINFKREAKRRIRIKKGSLKSGIQFQILNITFIYSIDRDYDLIKSSNIKVNNFINFRYISPKTEVVCKANG